MTTDPLASELARDGIPNERQFCKFVGPAVNGEGLAPHWVVTVAGQYVDGIPDDTYCILDPTNQQFTRENYASRAADAFAPPALRPDDGLIVIGEPAAAAYQELTPPTA